MSRSSAEKVWIEGADFNNYNLPEWANEDTLKEVRDFLKTQTLYLTQEEPKTEEKKEREKERKQDDYQKTLLKTLKDASKKVPEKFLNAQSKIIRAFLSGSDKSFQRIGIDIVDAVTKKMTESFSSIPWIGGTLALALGTLTTTIAATANVINDMHDRFLEVYNSGMALGGSFVNLMSASASARMSVDDFAAAISDYSSTIKSLRTDTAKGAEAFGEISDLLRLNLRPLGQLGLSIGEINDYMGNYLETQRLMGSIEQTSATQRAATIQEYLVQITRLSQITGKHRRQLEDQIRAAQQNVQWTTYLSSLPAEVRENMQKATAAFAAAGDPAVQLFQDFVRWGGPATDESQKLMAIMGEAGIEIADTARRIKEGGSVTQEELENQLKRMGKIYENLDPATKQFLSLNSEFEGIAAAAQEFAKAQGEGKEGFSSFLDTFLSNWADQVQSLLEPFRETIAQLFKALNRSGGLFESIALATQSAFELVNRFFRRTLVPFLQRDFTPWVVWFTDWLAGAFNWLDDIFSGRRSFTEDIGTALGNAISDILTEVFWTLTPGGQLIKALLEDEEETPTAKERTQSSMPKKARGGIATTPSIFGEAGPEAAIPLDTGKKIPIAEVKGNFGSKELKELVQISKEMLQMSEAQTRAMLDLSNKLTKLTNVTKSSSSVVF